MPEENNKELSTTSSKVDTRKSNNTRVNPVKNKPDLPKTLKTNPFYDALNEKYRKLVNVTDTFDLELTKTLFDYRDVMCDIKAPANVVANMQISLNKVLRKALASNKEDFVRRQEIILLVIREDLAKENSTFGGIGIFNTAGVGKALKVKDHMLLLTFYKNVAPIKGRAKAIQNSNLQLVAGLIRNTEERNRFLAYYGALADY